MCTRPIAKKFPPCCVAEEPTGKNSDRRRAAGERSETLMATTVVSPPPCPTSPRVTPREPPNLASCARVPDSYASRPGTTTKLGRRTHQPVSSHESEQISQECARKRRQMQTNVSKDELAKTENVRSDACVDDGQPIVSFRDVNSILCSNPNLLTNSNALANLCTTLKMFLDANRTPSDSPNLKNGNADRLDYVIRISLDLSSILRQSEQSISTERGKTLIDKSIPSLHILLLQVFKVLLRKKPNRIGLGAIGVRSIAMLASAAQRTSVACEGSNAILNMCYEACNVSLLVEETGVGFLARFLHSRDESLQASAAGAFQSICFQYSGRVAARQEKIIGRLVELMESQDETVCVRVVGALHNLSSDSVSLRPMREAGCLPGLVKLLGFCSPMACTAAAGTIQNISREPASRELLLHKYLAVEPLANLLFGSDVQGQACAAGALLNIVGPDLGGEQHTVGFGGRDGLLDEKVDTDACRLGKEARTAFKKLLAESIAMGTIWQSLFEDDS